MLTRFILASGATNLADGIALVAWAWAATLLTRDPILVALVPLALRLPWVLFSLPAGIVTDRTDRRHLILAMDALRALVFATTALTLWSATPLPPAPQDGLAAPGLFAALTLAALLVGMAEVFRDNAAQTLLPALVGPDRLESANGRLWSVELIGNALAGPALGAFLIGTALALPFAANAVAYALALALIASLSGRFRATATGPRDWRRELREGAAFLRDMPLLRDLALITGVWNLLHQAMMVALVLHVQENLHLSAATYGLILSAAAVGGIAGSLLGPRITARLGPARTAQTMLAASVPAFLGVALAPGAATLALAMVLFEFSGLVWNLVAVSHRQRIIPPALLGRVNSLYRLIATGMMPLGLILSGAVMALAEPATGRAPALVLPFWLAAAGAALLSFRGWYAIGRGFTPPDGPPGSSRPPFRQS